MKQNYNREMSVIDTEVKAYFLGLLYADGCITEKTKVQRGIRLSLVDEELIIKIKSLFPFFNSETWDFGKYNKNSKIQYSIRKTSTPLFEDLVSHGLMVRKSTTNSDLVRMPNLEKDLVHHFIRGYFDGNGSISISSNRPNLRRFEICSVSKELLLQFEQVFKENNIDIRPLRAKKLQKENSKQLFVTECISGEGIIQMRNYLYKDSTIFLERKKKLFDSFRIIDIREKNPNCPLCKAINTTTSGGQREMKYGIAYRYYCHNCNKRFTTTEAHGKSGELLENQETDNQQPSLELNTL